MEEEESQQMFLGRDGSRDMRGTLRYSSGICVEGDNYSAGHHIVLTSVNVLALPPPPGVPDQHDGYQDQGGCEGEQSYDANNEAI